MIYLASPYSHSDPNVREHRFHAACRAASQLMLDGQVVFSPIAHGHVIAKCGLPTDWRFWAKSDREHLRRCDEMVVLMLDGWRESEGVQAEIRIAEEINTPVRYMHPTRSPTLAPGALERDDG